MTSSHGLFQVKRKLSFSVHMKFNMYNYRFKTLYKNTFISIIKNHNTDQPTTPGPGPTFASVDGMRTCEIIWTTPSSASMSSTCIVATLLRSVWLSEEKREAIWLSPMTKAHSPTEKSKEQRDNIKTPPKTSIAQRLWTDLGRSVGVTAVTPLVWLNRFTSAQPSHLPQQPCNQKDTHLEIHK